MMGPRARLGLDLWGSGSNGQSINCCEPSRLTPMCWQEWLLAVKDAGIKTLSSEPDH